MSRTPAAGRAIDVAAAAALFWGWGAPRAEHRVAQQRACSARLLEGRPARRSSPRGSRGSSWSARSACPGAGCRRTRGGRGARWRCPRSRRRADDVARRRRAAQRARWRRRRGAGRRRARDPRGEAGRRPRRAHVGVVAGRDGDRADGERRARPLLERTRRAGDAARGGGSALRRSRRRPRRPRRRRRRPSCCSSGGARGRRPGRRGARAARRRSGRALAPNASEPPPRSS